MIPLSINPIKYRTTSGQEKKDCNEELIKHVFPIKIKHEIYKKKKKYFTIAKYAVIVKKKIFTKIMQSEIF